MTVAAVARVGLLMSGKAQMIIQLSIQSRLDRYLGQHLPELVEVILCLDILGSRLSDCL
jgi:hypothetical protein